MVPLDDAAKRRWKPMAEAVERAGMTLWPWIEVARNPAMADAHPEWMAAIGGHHDDWRRRFPDAPAAKRGEVIKAWPWVPIGYAPAFDAHRQRLKLLLGDLPGSWAGVFLNDLQAGPSSCGCGNDQCRWALDYGSPPTAARTPGDDAAAKIVAELSAGHPGKVIIPVWVTECELVDLPDAKDGTGLCGRVRCAANDCWPRYARNWNPLLKATDGPIALGVWPETFRRDAARWIESDLALFQNAAAGRQPIGCGKDDRRHPGVGKTGIGRDRSVRTGRAERRRDGCSPSMRSINPGSRERCRCRRNGDGRRVHVFPHLLRK